MPLFLVLPALVVLAALMAWLLLPRRPLSREAWEPEDRVESVDQAQLDAAEREVQQRGISPDEDEVGDDWGPGAGTTP